jgi:hypothetical protein
MFLVSGFARDIRMACQPSISGILRFIRSKSGLRRLPCHSLQPLQLKSNDIPYAGMTFDKHNFCHLIVRLAESGVMVRSLGSDRFNLSKTL